MMHSPGILRILIVEDNVHTADALQSLLQLGNNSIQVAYCGADALNMASESIPHLILLDLGMPGMSGYDVAMALRKLPAFDSTIIAALTGWSGEADRARTKAAGFDLHLTKPLDFQALRHLLERVSRTCKR